MSCHGRNGEWNYHLQFQKLMAFLEDFKAITGFSLPFFTNFLLLAQSSVALIWHLEGYFWLVKLDCLKVGVKFCDVIICNFSFRQLINKILNNLCKNPIKASLQGFCPAARCDLFSIN